VRHAMEQVKGDLRQIEFGHVEAIRGMREGRVSAPGLVAERSFEWLRLVRREELGCKYKLDLRFELLQAEGVYNVIEHQLDWGRVCGPLTLRSWKPGDRYRRPGRNREEKLKDLFQEARVPVWERRCWPVLLCGESIGWTREFGVAAGLERTEGTRLVLCVHDLSGFPNRNP
jgi:tRNA(Ile)-lysidine synthase